MYMVVQKFLGIITRTINFFYTRLIFSR